MNKHSAKLSDDEKCLQSLSFDILLDNFYFCPAYEEKSNNVLLFVLLIPAWWIGNSVLGMQQIRRKPI